MEVLGKKEMKGGYACKLQARLESEQKVVSKTVAVKLDDTAKLLPVTRVLNSKTRSATANSILPFISFYLLMSISVCFKIKSKNQSQCAKFI